jgi:polysaccharide biosynthesis protein PslH
MTSRRRALHVAPIMPARTGNGLAMRQGLFLEALSRQFETDLLVLPVADRPDRPPALPDELRVRTKVIPVAGRADTLFSLLSRMADPAARAAAFAAYGRSSLAAHVSAAVLEDVRQVAGKAQYDLVHVGRSYLAEVMAAVDPEVAATLDLDEDEWTSYRELAEGARATDAPRAAWLEAEAVAMSRLTAGSAPRFASHFISSQVDADRIFQQHRALKIEVVANAVALPAEARRADDGATVLFLGAYGYAPNVDAATWFGGTIWPLVREQMPEARLVLAGRDAERIAALAASPGVEIVGEVADLAEAYAKATLFVAPLRAGAGTRLKLMEAAAHGVPMVTTTLGARGLAFVPERDLLVADAPEAFAEAVTRALGDRAASERRAASALAVVRQHHDRTKTIERLACRLGELAAR